MKTFRELTTGITEDFETDDMIEFSVRGGDITFDRHKDGSIIVDIDRGSERAIIPITKQQAKTLKRWL